MTNHLKLMAISASISLAGCASTPYNAGQYALDNQRLTSETSLEAVEPDEQFSDAMKIMYDYSQVDIDYKNDLDRPYVRGGTAVKDAISIGGTAALLASGASLLDTSSFLFGTSYKKDIHSYYNENRIIRFVEINASASTKDSEEIIESHKKQLAAVIAQSYRELDVEFTNLDESNFPENVTPSWVDSSNYVVAVDKADPNKTYSKLCEADYKSTVDFITRTGGISRNNCQAFVLNHFQSVKNDDLIPVAGFNGKPVSEYVVITAVFPEDFPMSKLNSTYEYDYAYKPAFAWYYGASTFARTYGEDALKEKFIKGDVTFLPTLTALKTGQPVRFTYQNKP